MTDLPTIQMEAKKDGLQQTQDGLWKVTLRIHPNDMTEEFVMASMGQRFQVVMVAIGDDETPKKLGKPEKPKRTWEELTPAEQAGIRCGEPEFREWLQTQMLSPYTADTAEIVRRQCGVSTRADLNTNPEAARKWHELDMRYMAETGRMAERMG